MHLSNCTHANATQNTFTFTLYVYARVHTRDKRRQELFCLGSLNSRYHLSAGVFFCCCIIAISPHTYTHTQFIVYICGILVQANKHAIMVSERVHSRARTHTHIKLH